MGIFHSVLLAGAVQGIFLSVFLLFRRQNRLANIILACLTVAFSLQILLVANDNQSFFLSYPHLSRVGWLIPSLFGPLFFLFVYTLIQEEQKWEKWYFLHFIPFIACLLFLLPYYLQNAAAKRAFLDQYALASQDDFGMLNQFLNLLHVIYLSVSVIYLRKHTRRIDELYSETSQRKLLWLRRLNQWVLGILMVGILVFYAKKFDWPLISWLYPYHYLGVVALIYWIGYKALAQPEIFQRRIRQDFLPEASASIKPREPQTQQEVPPSPTGEKYARSTLSEIQAEQYLKELLSYMEQEKPHLNENLSIYELSDALQISKHHLSQVINGRLQKNFYDFINSYRVEEVKKLIKDPRKQHLNTLALALEAGFKSKATFNASFKKLTGMTPSEYQKKEEVLV